MTVRGVLRRRLAVSQRLVRKISNAAPDDPWAGSVRLNGEPARFKDRVKKGDRIGLTHPDEASHFIPQDIPIEVIYEDDDIIAVNKQPGLVVHPTKGHVDGTVANGLMRRMEDRGESYKIRFANRLDMDTSGVLLACKNAHAQNAFARQSGAGCVRKLYIAVLDGIPNAPYGTIDAPIAPGSEGSPRRTVRADGAESRTFYRVLETYDYEKNIDGDVVCDGKEGIKTESRRAALALISITSGRTHQIRVHAAHIGCPVLGDELYGRRADDLIGRQALHAAVLRFRHPATREEITLTAPLPDDMTGCLKRLDSG
jgi:23S rRNA pseudouridine1911/1915/1917 synthase